MENLSVIRSFGILYRTFVRYTSKAVASRDLSFQDSVFLMNIGQSEGISQEEIAHALAIDKAAIARSIKNMEKNGYITAKKSLRDKRAKELYLTAAGRGLFQYMLYLYDDWLQQVFLDLSAEEILRFAKTVDGIGKRAKAIQKQNDCTAGRKIQTNR